MSEADLSRVRSDLDIIKQAAGEGLPFGREDVRVSQWCAALGLLTVVWAVAPIWGSYWMGGVLAVGGGVGAARAAAAAHHKRCENPVRWRENRACNRLAALGSILAIAYLLWQRWVGIPFGQAEAAPVFFCGVALLLFATTDWRRLYLLGGAAPLMAFGLVLPLCPGAFEVRLAAGATLLVGGCVTAIIQHFQLVAAEGAPQHAAD